MSTKVDKIFISDQKKQIKSFLLPVALQAEAAAEKFC